METSEKILDLLDDPILLLKSDGSILTINASARRNLFSGLSTNDTPMAVGDNLQKVVAEPERALQQKLRLWARSTQMKPGRLCFKNQKSTFYLATEGAGIYQKGANPLILLRFPKKFALLQNMLHLKEQIATLHREIDSYKNIHHGLQQKQQHLLSEQERLYKLAYTDNLTNIPNRAFFHHCLTKFWSKIHEKKEAMAFTLVIFDIDYFKQYNDHYGHLQGDNCLKIVAQVIHQTFLEEDLREQGTSARYGGEEFVLVLLKEAQVAAKMVEKIFNKLAHLKMPHPHSPWHGVTVSAGLATYHAGKDYSPLSVFERADQNLYRAKQQGRRRLVSD